MMSYPDLVLDQCYRLLYRADLILDPCSRLL